MSEYIPSFIIEPVLRHARRFSERIGTEDQNATPTITDRSTPSGPSGNAPTTASTSNNRFNLPQLPNLPVVPTVGFQRFYPSRLWNQSPPSSATGDRKSPDVRTLNNAEDDEENLYEHETTLQSIARNIQLWANQINNLDVVPSPPLEPVSLSRDMDRSESAMETTEFPPLDVQVPQQPPSSSIIDAYPITQPERHDSDTSLNPANELPYRARVFNQREGGRSHSDPLTAPNIGQNLRLGNDQPSVGERMRDWSGSLPEDDGMGPLRKRITAIWAGPGTAQEKSHLVHVLMTERYRQGLASRASLEQAQSQPRLASPSRISEVSQVGTFDLSAADLSPTYVPVDHESSPNDLDSTASRPVLGCVHYKRNVKMQCNACEKWYTCRLCHDEVENHQLPRRETRHMLCMLCSTPQRVAQDCKMCTVQAACYYCAICKLWNNDPSKSIYHCDDCGICRLGEGLGKDFFHCKTCAACMSIQAESTHKCVERSTKCDCPICGEYMFTSNKPVAFMRCGHSIHELCFGQWCETSYKCPICFKSITNMESQFRRLDRHIEEQPMPEEYSNNRAYVFCNDCNSRSVTNYHWLGLKCVVCDSYNTAQLELLGPESNQIQERADRAQELGVGESALTASQTHTPTEEDLTQLDSDIAPGNITPSNSSSRPTTSASTGVDIPSSAGFRSPPSRRDSPFHHLPSSPPNRSTRGLSPAIGNYFNTGQPRPNSGNRRASYLSVFSSGSARDTDDISSTPPIGIDIENSNDRTLTSSPQQLSGNSSFLQPHLQQTGLGPTGRIAATEIPRRGTLPLEDDEDLDFWGGQSPRSYDTELVDAIHSSEEEEEEEEEEDSSDDDDFGRLMEDDDDDDDDEGDDVINILGHR